MATVNELVINFARSQVNKQVGSGECFDLANSALKNAGAKTAADFGTVTADADYVWGDPVSIDQAQPGDILQFRDYETESSTTKEVALKFPDGSTLNYDESSSNSLSRPHHTAVVASATSQGTVAVLEQNVDRGRRVMEKTVNTASLAVRAQPARVTKSTERITINQTWGQQVKRNYSSPTDKKMIDDLVAKNLGKMITADVQVTVSVSVKGSIQAYRPQAK